MAANHDFLLKTKSLFSAFINQINRLNASKKIAISLIIGLLAYFLFPFRDVKPLTHLLFGWDWFALCQLGLAWVTFYSTTPAGIREQAHKQDDKSVVLFFIVLIATCCSMLAVLLLLISKSTAPSTQTLRLILAIGCMLLSWLLVHTIFAIRYAHLYYADNENLDKKAAESSDVGGLIFPEDKEPDFLDFAYFSFTVGMTFQVSDIEISSKKLRRMALLHSLISFGYNATIIALSVNVIGGLTKG